MAVERENAVINEQIILRQNFRFARTGDLFDPDDISKVEILDSDGTTVLETITGAEIVKDATGKYHVVASAISTPKTIYDKWYFTPAPGASEITDTETCVVWKATTEPPGGVLEVGTNTWVTEQEAGDYFVTRLGSDAWDNASNADKIKTLITAYTQLTLCNYYDFPTDVSLFSQAMKYGQCEQALFLLIHIEDIDRRKGLQAQGVTGAGIVKETYGEDLNRVPICVNAKNLLADYNVEGKDIYAVDLARDEEEDVT